MISAAATKDGWICFVGHGREMLKFSACVQRNLQSERARQRRGMILVPKSSISAIIGCAREFGVDLSEFAETINEFRLHEEARCEAMRVVDEQDDSGIPVRWAFLEKHQKVAVNALSRKNLLGACLFDEQGTGKTLSALAAFDMLKEGGDIDFMIVVAPQTALNSWRDDAEKMPPPAPQVSVAIGDSKAKENAVRIRADIYALSYETLNSLLVVAKATARRGKCLLVVDEAFNVKNPAAMRSASVRELRSVCARAFVLSGTPAPRAPDDIIHQSDVADKGYAFQGYRSSGDRLRDAEEVHKVLANRSAYLRREKSEVLPMLPPKDLRVVSVALSGRQRELYERTRDDLAVELRDMNNELFSKNIRDYFAKRARLLQLCGCPSMADPMFPNDHAKIRKLDELVEEIVVQNRRKLVIWTAYNLSVNEIRERYERHGVAVIRGETPAEERRAAIARFQNDPAVKIFLGNPAAAGAGITLHAAADAVYVSYTDTAADFMQSIDRIHRIGQSADSVRYHFLVCDNTIETNQIRLLRDKILRQHFIFGENAEWPASVEEALEELEDE